MKRIKRIVARANVTFAFFTHLHIVIICTFAHLHIVLNVSVGSTLDHNRKVREVFEKIDKQGLALEYSQCNFSG